jgi:hypothetical protein
MRMMRDGPPPDTRRTVVDLLDNEDENAEVVRRHLRSLGGSEQPPQWIRAAAVADARRQSAICRLLLDRDEGRATLVAAAEEYDRLGLPFGDFLGVAATGALRPAGEARDTLGAMLHGTPGTAEKGLIGWSAALTAPAQQVALLLTAVSDPVDDPEFNAALASAPLATSAAPVGAIAEPAALWWAAGRELAALATDGERTNLAEILADLATEHGRRLRAAQYDQFHWSRACSGTDLVDLEIAGLTAISVRVLRRLGYRPWTLNADFGSLAPLARVSLTVGLLLADDGDASAGGHRPRPGGPEPSPVARSRSRAATGNGRA